MTFHCMQIKLTSQVEGCAQNLVLKKRLTTTANGLLYSTSAGLTKSLKSFRSCWQCVSKTVILRPELHSPACLEMSSTNGLARRVSLKEESCTWQDNTMLALKKRQLFEQLIVRVRVHWQVLQTTVVTLSWFILESGLARSPRIKMYTCKQFRLFVKHDLTALMSPYTSSKMDANTPGRLKLR